MKTWNKAEIRELNINETANGLICTDFETFVLFNDDKKTIPPEDEQS